MNDFAMNATAGAVDLAGAADARSAEAIRQNVADGRTDEAAEQLEALFSTLLVKEMRSGLSDGFFGSGPGAYIFDGWLDEHLGAALAERSTLDLAGAIKVNLGQKEALVQAAQDGEAGRSDA